MRCVFLGDEALGFGDFGFAECGFNKLDIKGLLNALSDGGSRCIKIDGGCEGFRERDGVAVEFACKTLFQAGFVAGQKIGDLFVLWAEQERPVLQEHFADALLRATDEFASPEFDFVLRCAGKTGRGEFFAAR